MRQLALVLLLAHLGCTGMPARDRARLHVDRPAALAAAPQEEADPQERWPVEHEVVLIGGIGLTGDPDTFLFAGQADIYIDDSVAVGPAVQLGVSDDDTIFALTAQAKKVFHLNDEKLWRWRPFVQGGVGFAYIEKEVGNRDRDDTGLLVNIGGGIEYLASDELMLGSTLMVNLLPGEVAGEGVYISWEILTVGVWF